MASNNYILITIISIFLIIGFLAPIISAEFGLTASSIDTEEFVDNVGSGDVSGLDILWSVVSIFFWTFGTVPAWLDLLFVPFRVILYVIIYDKIRGI